jgi:hypothetical protein
MGSDIRERLRLLHRHHYDHGQECCADADRLLRQIEQDLDEILRRLPPAVDPTPARITLTAS